MSAYVVEKEHIDVVLKAAVLVDTPAAHVSWLRSRDPIEWAELGADDTDELARIGGELLAENVRSVLYRYDDQVDDLVPAHALEAYAYTDPGFVPTVAEALKAVECVMYQSSEHSEWESSESYRFCAAVIARLVRMVPGYEEAVWEWDADAVRARCAFADGLARQHVSAIEHGAKLGQFTTEELQTAALFTGGAPKAEKRIERELARRSADT